MTTSRIPRRVLAAGALGAAALGGLGTLGALSLLGGSNPALRITNAAATADSPATPAKASGADCGDRTPLDEATAAKVKAAALEAVPGATVDKTHHDRADGYVALLTKADKMTRVLVHEDAAFKVTKVEDPAPARHAGGRGPGDRAPLDDATAAKVNASAVTAVPDATVDKAGHDRADGYVALLTKSDGTTRVLVHEDKDFKVTDVKDPASARGPGGAGHGPGYGDDDAPNRATPTTTAAA